MKKILLITLIFLVFPTAFTQATVQSAKISASPEMVDLGKILTGEILEKVLEIKNVGDTDLVITAISTDCRCSAFAYLDSEGKYQPYQTNNNLVISTGETLSLKLIFDPDQTNHRGTFKKYIFISSNDPDLPIIKIPLAGEIYDNLKNK